MGHGSKLTSCYAVRLFLLAAAMYVDDTYLLHWGNFLDMEDGSLIRQVQSATNDFVHLVQATRGALKPSKCLAYFLAYHRVNGKMKLKALKNLPAPLAWVEIKNNERQIIREPSHVSVSQSGGSPVPVPTKDVSNPTLMLGVHYAPLGNGIHYIDAMKHKGDLGADRQQTRPLCASDAWLSFFMALYPGMSMYLSQ